MIPEAEVLEAEIAETCGILNVATGRLVSLIGRVLATESYAGVGIRSPEQWVAWKCGVSPGRARTLVAMARRLEELPKTRSALEAGELAEDQVAVIVRHVPAHNDAEVATLARSATVTQLRRTLGRSTFAKRPPDRDADAEGEAKPEPEPEEARRVSFDYDEDGTWRLSAALPADEGALLERALDVARQRLMGGNGDTDHGGTPRLVSWADALVAMGESSLATDAVARPHYDRHLVVIHVGTDDDGRPGGHLHLGPPLPDSLRRFATCDARARAHRDATALRSVSGAAPASCPGSRPSRSSMARRVRSGSRGAPAPSGSTCTTSSIGKTVAPPIQPI